MPMEILLGVVVPLFCLLFAAALLTDLAIKAGKERRAKRRRERRLVER